ncbi:hypothetical protein [Streptomyces sp. NPDC055036]
MSGEREIYEYEVGGGKIYLRIQPAELKTYGNGWDGKAVSEEIRPRVEISTDAEFKGEVGAGFVKVQGRKYTFHNLFLRLPEGEGRLDMYGGGITMKWGVVIGAYDGYRNEKGGQISRKTKAYGELRSLVFQALNRFEKDHPQWQTESVRRAFEYKRNASYDKAAEAQEKAGKAGRAAAEWQARIDALDAGA